MSPYPRFDVNLPLQVKRRVAVAVDRTVTITEASEDFRGRIYPPHGGEDTPAADASPRAYAARHVLWYKPGKLADDVGPGDRVSDGLDEYEVVRAAQGKRAGLQVLIVEAQVIKTDVLYPVLAELMDKGGEPVLSSDMADATPVVIPVSLWQTGENDTDRGTYRGLSAEAPVEHYEALSVTNRELKVADKVHRIDDVTLHLGQPHVSVTLRAKA